MMRPVFGALLGLLALVLHGLRADHAKGRG